MIRSLRNAPGGAGTDRTNRRETGFRNAARKLGRFTRQLLMVAAISIAPAFAQEERPNIILVLFDDVGFSGFGAYGADARTPNIDALAGEGMLFSRYYSSPFCGPSRAMLLTGMDNHQVGMGTLVETVTDEMRAYPGYSMAWESDQETIATLLSEAGYQTYVTGKWGIGATGANLPDRFGFDRSFVMDATGGGNYDASHYLPGYDEVDWFEDGEPTTLPEDFYSSRTLVDRLIEYIDEGDADRPFFGFLSLQAVHIPVQAPLEYINAYDGVFERGWDVMREERLERAIDLGLVPASTQLAPAPAVHRAWDDLTPEEQAVAAREMQVNAGMMEAADHHFGRLISHLEAIGELDNTIIIVTSDNGAESAMTSLSGAAGVVVEGIKWLEGFDTSYDNLGLRDSLTAVGPEWASVLSAPFNYYKFYSGEGGLRVPLVISGPGVNASGIHHAPVHVADLTPTLLDAAGVSFDPELFYGRSALPVLSGAADASYADDEAFAVEVSGNAALYRGNWKITRVARPIGDYVWRLYDLSVDPGETTDLSDQHPELFADMLAEYDAYAETVGVFEGGPDNYAAKVLGAKVANKALHKYWYIVAGLLLAAGLGLSGVGFAGYRFVRQRRMNTSA
ncbi:arylsulfatase [Oceanicaulis alexandrii]|uniref:arylsulfatase n=1 Tax=Oceanicaulis alexandrii TaxID=153233 RepID=UPI0035D0989B